MNHKKIYVTKTSLPPYDEYIKAIESLWDSRFITNMGKYHHDFESRLKDFLQVPNLSLMVNGHMALEMTIQAHNFPKGSEVITTPFTFVSTTHAIVRNGLVPIFCDIKADNFLLDESRIEELITENTVAIVPVHVYGNVCNIEVIESIAQKYDLKVIYDAAHAFGVKYKGSGIGSFGNASIFSFHATKVFNSIEGGAVASNNSDLPDKIYNLKNFGIRNEELVVSIGANAKMNEFQAIMGICNLKYFERNVAARKLIVEKYHELLCNVEGVRLLCFNEDIERNYAYFPVLFEENEHGVERDDIFNALAKNQINARKYFYPLTADQACFKNKYHAIPLETARYCSDRIMVLPLYPELLFDDVERICDIIKDTLSCNEENKS